MYEALFGSLVTTWCFARPNVALRFVLDIERTRFTLFPVLTPDTRGCDAIGDRRRHGPNVAVRLVMDVRNTISCRIALVPTAEGGCQIQGRVQKSQSSHMLEYVTGID